MRQERNNFLLHHFLVIFIILLHYFIALLNCITMQHFKKIIIKFNTQFMSTNSTTKSLHVLASRVENSS